MKWFDVDGFLEYMQGEFPTAMENSFTRELLENIVHDLIDRYDDSTYLAHAIAEIVPEIEEKEVLQFCKL